MLRADVTKGHKLQVVCLSSMKTTRSTIQEVIGCSGNKVIKTNGTATFYETVEGISFIRSLLR